MSTLAPDVTQVTAPIDALLAWLSRPETRQRMQEAVSEAVAGVEQHILNDTSRRIPRQKAEREGGFRAWLDAYAAGGFDQWLDHYKRVLARQIQDEMLNAFPTVFAGLRNRNMISETVETLIWPEIEPQLRARAEAVLLAYAIRGIALAWVSRNVGDGALLGRPEAVNGGWRVPLYHPGTKTRLADVLLDADGEILSDAVSLTAAVQAVP